MVSGDGVTVLVTLLAWFGASVVAAPAIGHLLFGRSRPQARSETRPDRCPALTSVV
jgi:hypothetical protein